MATKDEAEDEDEFEDVCPCCRVKEALDAALAVPDVDLQQAVADLVGEVWRCRNELELLETRRQVLTARLAALSQMGDRAE
jgi:hypothetical protein